MVEFLDEEKADLIAFYRYAPTVEESSLVKVKKRSPYLYRLVKIAKKAPDDFYNFGNSRFQMSQQLWEMAKSWNQDRRLSRLADEQMERDAPS